MQYANFQFELNISQRKISYTFLFYLYFLFIYVCFLNFVVIFIINNVFVILGHNRLCVLWLHKCFAAYLGCNEWLFQ